MTKGELKKLLQDDPLPDSAEVVRWDTNLDVFCPIRGIITTDIIPCDDPSFKVFYGADKDKGGKALVIT